MSNDTKQPLYRGSSKHKNRPAAGAKGTLCPEWTHSAEQTGLRTDMHAHPWGETVAAALFGASRLHAPTGLRYATRQGVAFEAKPTNDGTWHGFPVPWEHVPADIKDDWIANGEVSGRAVKRYFHFEKSDIHWALKTDEL